MDSSKTCDVRIIASKENWIEGNAVSQLRGTAALPDMQAAVGLPDLHPGKSGPVGAAFITRDLIYPHLIGNDIGCGMSLFRSTLLKRKVKLDTWTSKIPDLDRPWEGNPSEWLNARNIPPTPDDAQLGTVGGGNHFAELQACEEIVDREAFARLGFEADKLLLLVHSGSRGLGSLLFRLARENGGYEGLPAVSAAGQQYLANHDYAVKWALANRALIASRFLRSLGGEASLALDLPHNFVERAVDGTWLHRKGAAPSNRGVAVVPGSRGAYSYLVEPTDPRAESAWSISHGAGRKWNRTDCRARLSRKYSPDQMSRNPFGGRVICEDRGLIYEEAPQAYKDVEVVVNDLVEESLIRVVAKLKPLITYKTRRNAGRDERKEREEKEARR